MSQKCDQKCLQCPAAAEANMLSLLLQECSGEMSSQHVTLFVYFLCEGENIDEHVWDRAALTEKWTKILQDFWV